MKVCKYFHQEQADEASDICKIFKGKTYRRLNCKNCKRIYNNQRRASLRTWLIDYKKMLVCERCGVTDFRALEFHHKVYDEKTSNVADMVRSVFSIKSVRQEINKCIVLCSNCHRIEHYDERD